MNKVKLAVGIGLAIWFGIIFILGSAGTLDTPQLALPLHLLIGVVAPIAVFLVLYRAIGSFRAFVLAADLRLVIGIQAWRFAGLGFLALYTYDLLPGLFALPAGLGDIAIGLTAPWVVLALTRRPEFAASNGFVLWHLLGLLDLVVAVTTGILGSGSAIGIGGEITTDVMGQLPLVLIPCYFVPIFIMLHLTALFQVRQRST
jgi:hypothetical protein